MSIDVKICQKVSVTVSFKKTPKLAVAPVLLTNSKLKTHPLLFYF